MPALPPVPGALKISFQHLINNVPAFVHWYFKYTGTPPASTDAATIANTCKSAWTTNFAPLLGTQGLLNIVQVTDLSSATGAQNQSSGTVTGTRTGTPLSAGSSVLVNQHLTRRYRGGKPRQYWPFGTNTDVATPQTWNTTFQNSFTTAYNAMVTAINAITWAGATISGPINISYFQGFTVVTNPSTGRAHNVPKLRSSPVVDTITTSSTNPRIASQRRRAHFSA